MAEFDKEEVGRETVIELTYLTVQYCVGIGPFPFGESGFPVVKSTFHSFRVRDKSDYERG